MTSLRKKLIIIGIAVVAVIAIITAVFACDSSSNKGNSGGDPSDNKYTCTVTFDLGYGTYLENIYKVVINKGSTVKRPSEDPTRAGYIFRGWNTTGSQDDRMWYFDYDRVTTNITLQAVWVREVTVTFYAWDGTFADGSNEYTVTVAQGDKITPPEVTPPDDYSRLHHWAGEYVEWWDFDKDTVNSDMRFYAHWDLRHDILVALSPFKYTDSTGGIRIDGVEDSNVSGTLTVPSCVTSISNRAFRDCTNLTSVVIEDGVTNIGSDAFYGCSALQSVRLPDTLTEIGGRLFYGCTALQQIQLPDVVTEIGDSMFMGCSSLRQVKLGDNVTSIGSSAFEDCTALIDFQIPASVEQLGDYAFEGCTALKAITIPAACKSVSKSAFKDCTALTSAELHCETIGDSSFMNCTALTDIMFGAEVRTIGAAFVYCTALTEVDIPDTVTTLSAAFPSCTNLRTVKIGNGVEAIGTSAFVNCYSLRNVTIGSSVKEIGFRAFDGCISLLSITIPSNVETIGTWAFLGCDKLVEVYNLSEVSYSFSARVLHTDASEESVVRDTPDGFSFAVLDIYQLGQEEIYLLDYWGDSEDLVLPNSYNGESYKIYHYALARKPQLKSVKISAGVTGIYTEILYGSDNVTSLTVDSANTVFSSAGNCVIYTADKYFVLGCKASVIPTDGSVTSIGSNVFCHNATVTEFSIPDSVTKISSDAFNGCYGIIRTVGNVDYVDKWAVRLSFYSSTEKLDLEFQSGTVGIINSAFHGSSKIRSVKFNDEMKYVCNGAFWNCAELTSVTFNDGLVRIDGFAFEKCTKLQEVVIPDSVEELSYGVFYGCTALTYAKLPSGLTYIDRNVFNGCTALEGVVIPQSVEQMSYGILTDCPDTVKIYYCGAEQQWNAINIDKSNDELNAAEKYYYSETEIVGVNCWHYGADGKPTTTY